MWKEKIFDAYNRSWLEEIDDDVLDFTHKTSKYMLNHIKKQFLSLTNTYKKDQLRGKYFPWKPEEDIAVYFMKLHKEQERLENCRNKLG